MTTPKPRAAIYARISHDKTGEGLGVERQIARCRQRAVADGYEVAGEPLRDDSLSAWKANVERSGYNEVLRLLRTGAVDRVYVYSTDRLIRRTRDLLDVLDACTAGGAAVVALTGEGVDPASPNGKLIATVLGAVAEQESDLKAARIRAAYEQRAASGRPKTGGRRMFGYEVDGATPREAEAELIRDAAAAIIGGAALRSIATDWNARGFTSTLSKPIKPQMVRELLTNPYIAGMSTWNPADKDGRRLLRNRTVVANGTWTPIIDRATWERVNVVLRDPKRATNRVGNTPKRLLSGLLECQCGDPMYHRTRKRKDGSSHSYYGCKKTRKLDPNAGRTHVSIGADDADDAITRLILARLRRPDIMDAIARMSVDDAAAARVGALVGERAEALSRRDELEAAVAAGDLPVAVFTRTSALIAEQLEKIDADLAASSAAATSPLAGLAAEPDLDAWWGAADLHKRRAVVGSLVAVAVGPGTHGAKKFDPSRLHVKWKVVA